VSFLVQVLVLHFKFSDDEKQPITWYVATLWRDKI
jgi:hypothetical protein